ncbi:MAG: hypothetical protein WA882_15675, partial [Geitlerinemataceae cyanobacterium]
LFLSYYHSADLENREEAWRNTTEVPSVALCKKLLQQDSIAIERPKCCRVAGGIEGSCSTRILISLWTRH